MATEHIFVRGKTKWFRPDKPNQWGKYTHVLYPDTESLEKLRDLQAKGVKNVLKKDEDGWFVTFNRPTSILRQGKVVGIAPPEVYEADGKTPLKLNVGNGSDVTTKLEVYQHSAPGSQQKAYAARWLSSRVDNLVPYEMKKDMLPEEEKLQRGLDEQPEPLF